MASVGGTTCTFVHTRQGRPPAALREEIASWRMPGISGYGTALLGAANGEFSVTAVLLSNLAGVAVWEAALQALQGTVVSIVDDHGTTHTYCELERVSNARITPAYQPGTGVTKRGEIVLQGKKVG